MTAAAADHKLLIVPQRTLVTPAADFASARTLRRPLQLHRVRCERADDAVTVQSMGAPARNFSAARAWWRARLATFSIVTISGLLLLISFEKARKRLHWSLRFQLRPCVYDENG